MRMIIRDTTCQDTDEIINLIFNIWINEFHFDVSKDNYPDLKHIDQYYTDKDGLFLVAIIDAQIVGTIACDKLSHRNYVLKRMFVSKEHRGHGVAQSLLDALFQRVVYFPEQYDLSFFLSTKADQAIAAKKFYLKNGFRVITSSELPDKFPYFYQDDLFMLKNSWE